MFYKWFLKLEEVVIFEIYLIKIMDYIKKSLQNLNEEKTYEEIDTRLASGWYVDTKENIKKKKFKTQKVVYKISKKTK